MKAALDQLKDQLSGELYDDDLMRIIYATDASVYREWPTAVIIPKDEEDLKQIIHFANEHDQSIIPRAGGTSLAGQCVGDGLVVDVSKFFNKILEVNADEGWVRVQPGVIRDNLNLHLKDYGLFFGPNTSTANRAMIGGMVGNNSCGTTSIVYGSTRDHVLELKTILSDGSEATFHSMSASTFHQKREGTGLENIVYENIHSLLSDEDNRKSISAEFPKASIHRRNTGYAIDLLAQTEPFDPSGKSFNFCELLCGSEGTLAFVTEIKLSVDPLPPSEAVVVCAHFNSVKESLLAVQVAMKQQPFFCELMDKLVLDCTKENKEQAQNRFFIEGDPEAILMVEFRGDSRDEVDEKADQLIAALQFEKMGYAFPKVYAPNNNKVWSLRKAGLGALANLPGDPKAVACIEDTAVAIEDLPAYIEEFTEMMDRFGQQSVYYAHAGAGELHLRPILDLKKSKDRQLFHDITEETAKLVKKYQGSLSGEHGDGRVRAEFIPLMIGEHNYELIKQVKQAWDPKGIFNPGKIVNAPPMNTTLRYDADQETPEYETVLDFSEVGGLLRMAEKCNGSGDCRKLASSGGTMCPSYMATRDEKDTTRARANILREFLTQNGKSKQPFNQKEIYEVLDLCLSCKGCTSECPSNVDMAAMKAEFQYQYYKSNQRPISNRVFGNFSTFAKMAMLAPGIANWVNAHSFLGGWIKQLTGVAPERSLPKFSYQSLRTWYRRNYEAPKENIGKVYFFCDEFTNYNDASIGRKAISLLTHLGYEVLMPRHAESGRAPISKGMLGKARKLAAKNVATFAPLVDDNTPLIGLEPSAILSFRDEYPRLVRTDAAKSLAKNCLLIDEFFEREITRGNITAAPFSSERKQVLLHGHCHQKALSNVISTVAMLSLPNNYHVEMIPSGCCGMAGSFGYEANHYEVSMQVGELVLFPAVRKSGPDTIIAAPGTSCRHQILDGTNRKAKHPVEVLYEAILG